jgi:hypothetical protein
VGLNPDEVSEFFILPNPSSHTMALGFTQPLTEISTRNIPVGNKMRPVHKADKPYRLSRKCRILNVSQPYRPHWPVT